MMNTEQGMTKYCITILHLSLNSVPCVFFALFVGKNTFKIASNEPGKQLPSLSQIR